MPDLRFTTHGQAEALQAMEAQRAAQQKVKEETEKTARAAADWDKEQQRTITNAQRLLASTRTEQEKIVDKIKEIEEAEKAGIIPKEAAAEAVRRLRQEWIDVDEATREAKQAADDVAKANEQLKATATSALQSVRTEEERVTDELQKIEEQIEAVEAAAAKGLIPTQDAEQGLARLRQRLEELKTPIDDVSKGSGRFADIVAKAFDPAVLVKWAAGLVGVKALIGEISSEVQDLQTRIDKRIAHFQSIGGRDERLTREIEAASREAGSAATPEEQAAATERLAGLQSEQAALRQSPGYAKYQQVQRRDKELEQLYGDLAEMGDASQLSSRELEKMADVFRELGQISIERSIRAFATQLDDGVTSVGEIIDQLRSAAEQIPTETFYVSHGLGSGSYHSRPLPPSQLTEDQKTQIRLLERAVASLERIENGGEGIVGTDE